MKKKEIKLSEIFSHPRHSLSPLAYMPEEVNEVTEMFEAAQKAAQGRLNTLKERYKKGELLFDSTPTSRDTTFMHGPNGAIYKVTVERIDNQKVSLLDKLENEVK